MVTVAKITVPMPRMLRAALWSVFAALWGSGCAWLVLHFGFATRTPFGPLPNPWEATVLEIHGLLAVAAVFLVGWIFGSHVLERWAAGRNRKSGLMLGVSAAVLIVSGYMLYYTTDRLQAGAAACHEIVGVLGAVFAIAHWRYRDLMSRGR